MGRLIPGLAIAVTSASGIFIALWKRRFPTAFGLVERTSKPLLFWTWVTANALVVVLMVVWALGVFGIEMWPIANV
jgi:hypothetical protein